MKTRRVIVTVEVDTGATVSELKNGIRAVFTPDEKVHQIQVNVVQRKVT